MQLLLLYVMLSYVALVIRIYAVDRTLHYLGSSYCYCFGLFFFLKFLMEMLTKWNSQAHQQYKARTQLAKGEMNLNHILSIKILKIEY